jgi:Putative porin
MKMQRSRSQKSNRMNQLINILLHGLYPRCDKREKGNSMTMKKCFLLRIGAAIPIVLLAVQPLGAQTSGDKSESERLEKLERAVEQLQQRNAELEQEVKSLKKQTASASQPATEGKTKTKITSDGKTYVEKTVPIEKTSAEKWKLSTSIMELELYGDARLRYEYRGGETDDNSPLASSGAGVAGHRDWQERDRERYRLRLGLRGTLLDDWFFGVRLETGQNPRSTNVTFGDDTSGGSSATSNGPFSKTNDGINVGQAYLGYRGFPDITLTAGRMPNPLVSTLMVWDADINPEGLAEQWKHTFNIGTLGGASQSYSKDGKNVAPVAPESEPLIKLELFANFAQFVYDDSNPENPLGLRTTTSANSGHQLVPNTDAFLLAWQVGAKLNFPKTFYFQFVPTIYNYTGNGDTFNVHFRGGDPNLTNSVSLAQNQTGINSLLLFDVPMELGWKIDKLPMRIFGDFAVNLDGDDRAAAAGHPGHGDQRYAYQIGGGIGQLKKKHDWQLNVFWQRQDQYSLDPNLVDTEFWDSKLNLQGIGATAGYMLSDAVWVNFTYGYAWRADDALGTGGGGDIAINPVTNFQLFQADLNIKF